MSLLLLLVVLAVVVRVMTPDEGRRLVRSSIDFAGRVRAAVSSIRPCEPLRTNLRARTPLVFVTPAIIAVMCALFVAGNADALGNVGPRTTDGEWWRLATATFVHSGTLHLLVSIAGFMQPGLLLERLAGHSALAAVFLAAGVTSGMSGLSANPVGMNAGASGAIFGVYGLLLAALVSGAIRRSPVTVPLLAVKRMIPAAALFAIYHAGADRFEPADLVGLMTGLGCGAVLAIGLAGRKPPVRRIAAAMSATAVITVASAVTLGGIVDVRPELAQVLALEERTAVAYAAAVDRLRKGRMQAEALATLIEQTIVPELQAAGDRLSALADVPAEQQALVAHAKDYVRLRRESWRLRSEGLRTTNMLRLRQAERTERESLSALQRIKPPAQTPSAL